MSTNIKKDPDISLAGLKIWVRGRQFPEADDYWDGNWISVHARCTKAGASVHASGSFIHLSELVAFTKELARLNDELKGKAVLACMEPELSVQLEVDKLGHITVTVNITPEHLAQQHKFVFEIDQSYLGRVLGECRKVLEAFPLRGTLTDKLKKLVRAKKR